jgi:hypothetical protein
MTQTAEERDVTQFSPQWLTMLAGPLVWTVHFLVLYTLSEFGCRGGWLRGEWLGLPAAPVAIAFVTLVALAVSGLAAWRAYRHWRAGEAGQAGNWTDVESRDRFIQVAGWLLGLLFTFLILLTALPAVVLPRCG